MFERCSDLLRDYTEVLKRTGTAYEPEYVIEVKQRLTQLAFMVGRVRHLTQPTPKSDLVARALLEQQLSAVPNLREPAQQQVLAELREYLRLHAPVLVNQVEIEVLAQAFYYFGFRMCTVIGQRLPGLNGFSAEGIRDVRNKLLEHPDARDSEVIENGSAFDHARGPIIKGVRRVDRIHRFVDQGLYVNAQDLADKLAKKLQTYNESH